MSIPVSSGESMETEPVSVPTTVPVMTTVRQHIESYCELLSVNFVAIQSAIADFENSKKTIKAYRKLIFSSYKSLSKLPKDLVIMYLASIPIPLHPTMPDCLKPLQSLRENLELNDNYELQLILDYHENNLKTKRTDSGTKSKRGRKPKHVVSNKNSTVDSLESLEAEELAALERQQFESSEQIMIEEEEIIRDWDEKPQRLSTLSMSFVFANLPALHQMYSEAKMLASANDAAAICKIIDRKLHWIDIFQNGNVSIEDMMNEYGPSDIFVHEANI